jgi:hypothetical protein
MTINRSIIFLFASSSFYCWISIGSKPSPYKTQGTNYQAISLEAYLNELNDKNSSIKVKRLNSDSAAAVAKQAGMPHLSPILTYSKGSISHSATLYWVCQPCFQYLWRYGDY